MQSSSVSIWNLVAIKTKSQLQSKVAFEWLIIFFKTMRMNWGFAANSSFLIPISLQPVDVGFWYFKIRIFNLEKCFNCLNYIIPNVTLYKKDWLKKSIFKYILCKKIILNEVRLGRVWCNQTIVVDVFWM